MYFVINVLQFNAFLTGQRFGNNFWQMRAQKFAFFKHQLIMIHIQGDF